MTLIKPTRRDLLKLAAIAPAMAMPMAAHAKLGAPTSENPSHFKFTVGDAKMTVISDGYFTTSARGIGVNADPAEVQAFLASHYLPTDENFAHTNHLYIEIDDHKVLIDVGSGTRFLDTTGRLMDNLEVAGIDPQGITHVILTHAHPDHILGIRDDFDEAIIPDAQYFMGEVEHDYWLQDDLVNQVPVADQQFVLGAVNSINADGVDWALLSDGQEVVPGVTLMLTPGHTLGHMSVRIESGGETVLALGDCVRHAYADFSHPEWQAGRDTDKEMAVATRKRILDMAATDRMAVLGYHFPFPGVGHVRRDGDAYQFVPALWQF